MTENNDISFLLGQIKTQVDNIKTDVAEIKEHLQGKASKVALGAAIDRIKAVETELAGLKEEANLKKKDKKRLTWVIENGQNILLWVLIGLLIWDNTNLHLSLHQLLWH